MPQFVAFLRGINVGGHIVTKQMLKTVFEELDFCEVSTFKQSGNVILQSNETDIQVLTVKIEQKLQSKLSYPVAVIVRTIEQLKNIINLDAFKNQPTEGTSFLVTLLPNIQTSLPFQLPTIIPKSTAQIIAATEKEVFSVTHGSGEGALPNPFIESKLKIKTTTRNLNVIMDILARFG
jgi:uncharacterized protein (DUF1697 family)